MKLKGVSQVEAIKKAKVANSTFFAAKNYMTRNQQKRVTQEESYQKVTDFLKENPTASVTLALKKTKVRSSVYYIQRKKFESKDAPVKTKTKRKYIRRAVPKVIDVPVEHRPSKAVVIVCDPNDLRDVVSNLF